jgi:hypothetical protein
MTKGESQVRVFIQALVIAVLLFAAISAKADTFCEGMARADRLACIASKYDDYAYCQINKTYDEDATGPGSGDEEFAACRAEAYATYTACRADVDTCVEEPAAQ